MVYLMVCHLEKMIALKDGVDDGWILVMLVGSDFGFEYDI